MTPNRPLFSLRSSCLLLLFAALVAGGCKPAPCKPTREARTKLRTLVERYPGSATSKEVAQVNAEVRTALEGEPENKVAPFNQLLDATRDFDKVLEKAEKPAKSPQDSQFFESFLKQSRDHLLHALEETRDKCGD